MRRFCMKYMSVVDVRPVMPSGHVKGYLLSLASYRGLSCLGIEVSWSSDGGTDPARPTFRI